MEKAKKEAAELALQQAETKRILEEENERVRIANEQKELARLENLKSTKQKLSDWVNGFEIGKPSLEENEMQNANSIIEKFTAFKTWAINQISSLK